MTYTILFVDHRQWRSPILAYLFSVTGLPIVSLYRLSKPSKP